MGREIRRVPPHWEHPRFTEDNCKHWNNVGAYHPVYNKTFTDTFAEWLAEFDRIRSGQLTDFERECYPRGLADWLQDEGSPPDPSYYLNEPHDGNATWIQVYETVSEGTPVTPAFATADELVDYLAANGDFWDQKRRAEGNSIMACAPWEREAARRFVERGWAPSMTVTATAAGVEIREARDG